MVKSTISLRIRPIDTPLLLGINIKSYMVFPLVNLKLTCDLLFKVTCKNSCILVNFISFCNGIGHIKTIIPPVGAMHFIGTTEGFFIINCFSPIHNKVLLPDYIIERKTDALVFILVAGHIGIRVIPRHRPFVQL
jgi:hypothetical protein